MVWVHFNARGHLASVYIKEYFDAGMNARGVYMVQLDPCDPNDRATLRTAGIRSTDCC